MATNRPSKPRPLINGRFPAPPFWLRALLLVGFCASLLLFVGILNSRNTRSPLPRVHFIQDMDNQVKFKTQHSSDVFADGRASRPKVVGTVARGRLEENDLMYRGFTATWNEQGKKFDTQFLNGFPLPVDEKLLKRGEVKFNTYCMPCHGYDGQGNGPINARASDLAKNPQLSDQMGWVTPSNLVDDVRRSREDGHIYNTIVNGIRNMGGYGSNIQDAEDRWAIVAYVRALQTAHLANQQPAPAAPQASR